MVNRRMTGAVTTPVFLFSLPRSGSTLLQRILAAHRDIATTSEPWILLPLLQLRRVGDVQAVYRHEDAVRAIDDFADLIGWPAFDEAVRNFVLSLYRQAGGGSRYFLDKTPRYHLVVSEILDLFPEARAIFLWRNPLAVAASMMKTWAGGEWNLFRHRVDLETGLNRLVKARQTQGQRALNVRFEDLLTSPEETVGRCFEYLQLDSDPGVLEHFSSVRLEGRMGDPSGTRRFTEIDLSPRDDWSEAFATPLRRIWANRYLERVGEPLLPTIGYEPEQIRRQLESERLRLKGTTRDATRMAWGLAHRGLDATMEYRSRRYMRSVGSSRRAFDVSQG